MKLLRVDDSSAPAPAALSKVKVSASSIRGHLEIARVDYWIRNVFVFPGIVVALSVDHTQMTYGLWLRIFLGLLSTCLVASSNYVINEIIDAPSDIYHPSKFARAVPSGRVSIRWAYAQWILLMIVGVGLGFTISIPFAATMVVLWIMGCIYNIPPVRSKDLPYLDVLSEAVNNPIRMLAGWFIVDTTAVPPASLLLSYWMVGCYFMAIKRYAELKSIANGIQAALYRKSFAFYTEERLLVSIVFYGSAAMLFFGAFLMRYRLELVLAFPLVAFVMAVYLSLAFKENGAAQAPERLTREPLLMVSVIICAVLLAVLLCFDIPILHRIFAPTIFTNVQLWR
jgi:decaprenyl-phosphate phosphoribosyltransferase